MAKMVPEFNLDNLDTCITGRGAPAERVLYRYMAVNLPQEWTVIYDFSPTANGQDAQLDFLVIVPGKGIVNVDAKGAGYNVWPGPRVALGPGDKDVFSEASRGIHVVNAYIRDQITRNESWGAFGYIVAFAFTNFRGRLSGGHAYLEGSDFQNPDALKDKINEVLDAYPRAFRDFVGWEKAIVGHFTQPTAQAVAVPQDNTFDIMEQYSLRGLDPEQRVVAQQMWANRYVHVTGGAGTGKTIIAMTIAKEMAMAGKDVLYVCFNKSLAGQLERLVSRFALPANAGRIVVVNFHSLALKLFNVNLAVVNNNCFDRTATDENIHRQLPDLISTRHLKRFNALLVDEAQDLTQENIRSLLTLLSRQDRLAAIFSDAGQTIFALDWELNVNMFECPVATYKLSRNYRNTDKIFKSFQRLSGEDTLPMVVSGPDFSTKDVQTCGRDDVVGLVEEMLREGRTPKDIALISADNATLQQFKDVHNALTNRRVQFSDNLDRWHNGAAVLKATIQSFKGLEANVVFLFPPRTRTSEADKLRYVGESRAKYELYIVGADAAN